MGAFYARTRQYRALLLLIVLCLLLYYAITNEHNTLIKKDTDIAKRNRICTTRWNHCKADDDKLTMLDQIQYQNRPCQYLNFSLGNVYIANQYVNHTSMNSELLTHVNPVQIGFQLYGYPIKFRSLSEVRRKYPFCEHYYNDTQQTFTVLPDVLHCTYVSQPGDVSLLTQLTVDRFDRLERLLQAWPGPMSIVIYIYKHCIHSFMKTIANSKIAERKNVFLHLAVPHQYSKSVAIDLPLSMLRNMAVRGARTDFIFYVDVDFVPSSEAYEKILQWLQHYSINDKIAYVIPAFDVTKIAHSKEEFITDIKSGMADLFHIKSFHFAHKPTNLTKWMTSTEPYEVLYQDKFEPFCVFPRRTLPAYPEINAGRFRDKITHIRVLYELGYSFIVIPDAFIMHIDHPRPSKNSQRDMMLCALQAYEFMVKHINKTGPSDRYSVLNYAPQPLVNS